MPSRSPGPSTTVTNEEDHDTNESGNNDDDPTRASQSAQRASATSAGHVVFGTPFEREHDCDCGSPRCNSGICTNPAPSALFASDEAFVASVEPPSDPTPRRSSLRYSSQIQNALIEENHENVDNADNDILTMDDTSVLDDSLMEEEEVHLFLEDDDEEEEEMRVITSSDHPDSTHELTADDADAGNKDCYCTLRDSSHYLVKKYMRLYKEQMQPYGLHVQRLARKMPGMAPSKDVASGTQAICGGGVCCRRRVTAIQRRLDRTPMEFLEKHGKTKKCKTKQLPAVKEQFVIVRCPPCKPTHPQARETHAKHLNDKAKAFLQTTNCCVEEIEGVKYASKSIPPAPDRFVDLCGGRFVRTCRGTPLAEDDIAMMPTMKWMQFRTKEATQMVNPTLRYPFTPACRGPRYCIDLLHHDALFPAEECQVQPNDLHSAVEEATSSKNRKLHNSPPNSWVKQQPRASPPPLPRQSNASSVSAPDSVSMGHPAQRKAGLTHSPRPRMDSITESNEAEETSANEIPPMAAPLVQRYRTSKTLSSNARSSLIPSAHNNQQAAAPPPISEEDQLSTFDATPPRNQIGSSASIEERIHNLRNNLDKQHPDGEDGSNRSQNTLQSFRQRAASLGDDVELIKGAAHHGSKGGGTGNKAQKRTSIKL